MRVPEWPVLTSLLTDELLAHIGTSDRPRTEQVTRRDIRKYAVATGQQQQVYLSGEKAPPLFHVALFWHIVELDQLNPDGTSRDPLVPDFPLKRAMAGGVQIEYHRSIKPGDQLTAQRTLTNIYEKQGKQGPLIFYEITTAIVDRSGDAVLTEVYTRIVR